MNTYSVTGTYGYSSGAWGSGSGQFPGRILDAVDASEAAETYRSEMAARFEATHGGTLTETNVCAVSLTGPPETFSDPLAGVPA